MGINNKSFKGLSSTKRYKLMAMNKTIEHDRSTKAGKFLTNWQTTHKGYGVPMKKEKQ